MLTFQCEVCRRSRPDAEIGVIKVDGSKRYGLPEGSVTRNVNYCIETEACRLRAVQILRDFVEGKGEK